MRPGREGVTPLPVPALLPGEMQKSMRQAAPRVTRNAARGSAPVPPDTN
jgi:hypothetical protein